MRASRDFVLSTNVVQGACRLHGRISTPTRCPLPNCRYKNSLMPPFWRSPDFSFFPVIPDHASSRLARPGPSRPGWPQAISGPPPARCETPTRPCATNDPGSSPRARHPNSGTAGGAFRPATPAPPTHLGVTPTEPLTRGPDCADGPRNRAALPDLCRTGPLVSLSAVAGAPPAPGADT